MKIAIASADVLYRNILKQKLETIGYSKIIFEAKNGDELIKKIKTEKPQLLFMDTVLPEVDEEHAATIVTKLWQDIVIICQSNHLSNENLKKLKSIGVKGFLLKECDEKQLKKAIANCMSGKFYYEKKVFNETNETNETNINFRLNKILRLMFFDKTITEISITLSISEPVIYRELKLFKSKHHIKTDSGLMRFGFQRGMIDFIEDLAIIDATHIFNELIDNEIKLL